MIWRTIGGGLAFFRRWCVERVKLLLGHWSAFFRYFITNLARFTVFVGAATFYGWVTICFVGALLVLIRTGFTNFMVLPSVLLAPVKLRCDLMVRTMRHLSILRAQIHYSTLIQQRNIYHKQAPEDSF